MATLSPAKTFVILAGCDSCGQVHPVEFHDKGEFMQLRCRHTHAPIFSTRQGFQKVWRELHSDLKKDCLNFQAA